MSERFRIRQAMPSDAEGVARLDSATADGGAVEFRVLEHVTIPSAGDGLTRSLGVVATDPSGAQVVGSAKVVLGRCRYHGEDRPFALLGSLKVHPDHRRRGIGAALAQWRIAKAEELAGPDVVVVADIQRGNDASLAAARRWATGFTPPALTVPVRMRRRPTRAQAGLEIRPAGPADLPAVAAGVMAFTGDHDLARIWTPERLTTWLSWSPLEVPVRHCLIAVDRSGAVVAGLALREEGLLRTMELVRMPPAIRAANLLLHVVPSDGRLRNLAVEHLWFAPGHEAAAAALWQQVRWSWRERGTNLLLTLDARSPVRPLLGLRPWTPTTSITTAVRARPAPDPRRLIAPVA